MIKLNFAIMMLMLIIVLISTSYKYLKNKYKNHRYISKIFIVSVLVVLLVLYLEISGLRLTPLQASRAHSFVEDDAELLKEIRVGKNYLHIYYNPEEKLYKTTYTEDAGIFYESNSSTWYYPHEEDMLRTLGGNTVLVKGGYELVLYIETKDPQVTEIAIIDSEANHIIGQPVKVGEPTVIQYKYPIGVRIFDYKVVALNNNLDVIYYYGYEINNNQTSGDEYKWHVMKEGK